MLSMCPEKKSFSAVQSAPLPSFWGVGWSWTSKQGNSESCQRLEGEVVAEMGRQGYTQTCILCGIFGSSLGRSSAADRGSSWDFTEAWPTFWTCRWRHFEEALCSTWNVIARSRGRDGRGYVLVLFLKYTCPEALGKGASIGATGFSPWRLVGYWWFCSEKGLAEALWDWVLLGCVSWKCSHIDGAYGMFSFHGNRVVLFLLSFPTRNRLFPF